MWLVDYYVVLLWVKLTHISFHAMCQKWKNKKYCGLPETKNYKISEKCNNLHQFHLLCKGSFWHAYYFVQNKLHTCLFYMTTSVTIYTLRCKYTFYLTLFVLGVSSIYCYLYFLCFMSFCQTHTSFQCCNRLVIQILTNNQKHPLTDRWNSL